MVTPVTTEGTVLHRGTPQSNCLNKGVCDLKKEASRLFASSVGHLRELYVACI
jgi:hypothetical protein